MHSSELALKSECLLKSEEPRGPCLPYPSPSPGSCLKYKSGTNKWLIKFRICLILFILWRFQVFVFMYCPEFLIGFYRMVSLSGAYSAILEVELSVSQTFWVERDLRNSLSNCLILQIGDILNKAKKLCHRINYRERQ